MHAHNAPRVTWGREHVTQGFSKACLDSENIFSHSVALLIDPSEWIADSSTLQSCLLIIRAHRRISLFLTDQQAMVRSQPVHALTLCSPITGNPPRSGPGPMRAGTMPMGHRSQRSREENGSNSQSPMKLRGEDGPSVYSPIKSDSRRPRSNSESSGMDKDKRAEEDKKRRERRKEREARREKEGKSSKDLKSSRPTKRPQGLDIIDKLDVTGIYGQGRKSYA